MADGNIQQGGLFTDKLTKQFGKPICVLLYAVFAALAVRKKPWPSFSGRYF